jgi:thiamine-phosphate pyrophosphorylase
VTSVPSLLVLTDRTQCDHRGLVETVRLAVDAGARAVLLREKDLPRVERIELAEALRPILHGVRGVLVVASDATIEADGVHLAAIDPFPTADRPRIVGRSCHSIADVVAAEHEGCDYVTLSPIFATASKPGYGPALGIGSLGDARAASAVPVIALGGIDSRARATGCLAAGATGVAVMGAVMRDPTAVTSLQATSVDPREVAAGTGRP